MSDIEKARHLLQERKILNPLEIEDELNRGNRVITAILNGWLTEKENHIRMIRERFLKDERDLTPEERKTYSDKIEQWKAEKANFQARSLDDDDER